MTYFEPLNIQRTLPLRVEDFLLLNDTGAFEDYGKTELIDGGIIFMNAQHRPHSWVKMHLERGLLRGLTAVQSPLEVMVETTVAMPPHNAPEPDLIVTSEPQGIGPIPLSSVALLVEISDTTLGMDLGRKQKIYAEQGIPEYWVADVQGRVVHQMWLQKTTEYRTRPPIPFGEAIVSQTMAGLIVKTDRL